jgi:hypothetical protein
MSWTPAAGGLTLVNWSKADALSLSNNDPVSSWTDSSGNGFHLANTLTARPTYMTGQINSLPAVSFDGSNDFLRNSAVSFSATRSSLAVAMVVCLTTNKTYNGFLSADDNASYPAKGLHVYGINTGEVFWGFQPVATEYYLRTKRPLATSTWYIITASFGDQVRDFRANGADWGCGGGGSLSEPSADLDNITVSSTGNITIGKFDFTGDFLNGKVAEMVLWSPASQIENLWIEGYLANKYALTLPSNHLFYASPPAGRPDQLSASKPSHPMYQQVIG